MELSTAQFILLLAAFLLSSPHPSSAAEQTTKVLVRS